MGRWRRRRQKEKARKKTTELGILCNLIFKIFFWTKSYKKCCEPYATGLENQWSGKVKGDKQSPFKCKPGVALGSTHFPSAGQELKY